MADGSFSRAALGARLRLVTGDCREVLPAEGPFDLIIGDPPYGVTSLRWDREVPSWLKWAAASLKPTGSIWLFGSMKSLLKASGEVAAAGLRYAQDIVWEKQNGTGFATDRFRRVHEHAVQLYRTDSRWSQIYNDVQVTLDARPKVVRRKKRPAHCGGKDESLYVSVDGGPRLMRSVLKIRSAHGYAIHRTEKPVELLEILVRTSCPPDGLVGDFFAGSGAAGEACHIAGRRYIGAEINPEFADAARARLAVLQGAVSA